MKDLVKNKGLNRQQRRAQYATPSRSKPYTKPRHPKQKAAAQYRGLAKIKALLQRGFALNAKRVKPSKIATAVKNAFKGISR